MSYVESDKLPEDGGPPRKKRRRGTNIVEINNKCGARATVDHVTRPRSSLTHKKFLLFTLAHNLSCDKKIEHITGKKALKRNWFVRESLRNAVAAAATLTQANTPKTTAASNNSFSTVAAFADSEVGPSLSAEARGIGIHASKPPPAVIDPQLLFSQRLLGRQKSSPFSSEVWGIRTAAYPVATAQNTYINGPLNQFQRSKLAQAHSSVYHVTCNFLT